MLASVHSWAANALDTLGYPALVALMLACPPLPSEVILPLAGYFVGRGELVFPLALAAATVGAVGHALIVYALARWGGRRVLVRHGRLLRVDADRLDRVERWFARRGMWVVAYGRMMSVVRWVVGIPAGAAQMPLGRYALLTTLGCAGWNSLLLTAGWALGRNHGQAGHFATVALLIVLGAALVAGVVIVLRRRWRRETSPSPPSPTSS